MSPSPSPGGDRKKNSTSSSNKKLEWQTFLDLTPENQMKFILYLAGSLVLLMVGISSISGVSQGDITAGILTGLGVGGGAWLGSKGYNLLIDPKNEKKCNVNFWSVTESVGFEEDGLKNDLGVTLCKAQLKAEYGGFAGFYCTSNNETENTVDAYYIDLSDSKKLTLKKSGTSNVFTIKSGDNKITVTEPPGTFTVEFTSSSTSAVTIRAKSFVRIDETRDASVSVIPPVSPPNSPGSPQSVTVQQLKDGFTLSSSSPFASGTVFEITMYSTTQSGAAVKQRLNI